MLNRYVSKTIWVTFIVALLFSVGIHAQSNKEDLYKKREKILKEIEYTSKLLEATAKKKGNSVNKVKLINSKISKREKLINNYENEIQVIDNKIKDRGQNIQRLETELEKQRRLYADFIRYSYKNHNHYSTAIYLLASKNMNQLYLRKKYLEQLKDARKAKMVLIGKLHAKINHEINTLQEDKTEKAEAINRLKTEKSSLASEKVNRERIVTNLTLEEGELRKQIDDKRKIEEEIARKLEDIIRAEAKKSKYAKLTPEQQLVATDFERNKGRLPWPTRQGVITEKFGEHFHPVIKGVKVRNNGIDISTMEGEQVRSIFEGEISKIFSIKGANYTVIIKHGTYYTVYHNLYDVVVNVGDKIKTKQEIGRVSKNRNGDDASVHFEIWKGMDKLNPELWISN